MHLFNYIIDGFLRYEFMVVIAYENNPATAIKVIFETVNNVEGVLRKDYRTIHQTPIKQMGPYITPLSIHLE
ncbi:hypothetical protein QA597_00280 [Marinilabiliaceae bacterium ANBcel2]|nr:hypothetical protein [Marinilabiliaceae bacterium ANBcel2]